MEKPLTFWAEVEAEGRDDLASRGTPLGTVWLDVGFVTILGSWCPPCAPPMRVMLRGSVQAPVARGMS